MSYFEPNPTKADSVAADDVRETESSPPAEPRNRRRERTRFRCFRRRARRAKALISLRETRPTSPAVHLQARSRLSQAHGIREPAFLVLGAGRHCERSCEARGEVRGRSRDPGTFQAVCTGIEKRLGQVEDTLALCTKGCPLASPHGPPKHRMRSGTTRASVRADRPPSPLRSRRSAPRRISIHAWRTSRKHWAHRGDGRRPHPP